MCDKELILLLFQQSVFTGVTTIHNHRTDCLQAIMLSVDRRGSFERYIALIGVLSWTLIVDIRLRACTSNPVGVLNS